MNSQKALPEENGLRQITGFSGIHGKPWLFARIADAETGLRFSRFRYIAAGGDTHASFNKKMKSK